MQKKISIIIPLYNVEKYIEKCLLSIFDNKIIFDCEIILIDDCSTDRSLSIAKNLLENQKNISYSILINDKNLGSALTRQKGLNIAIGKYVIFIDSDDYVESDYLEKLYINAELYNADIMGCSVVSEFKNYSKIYPEYLPEALNEFKIQLFTNKIHAWLPAKLFNLNFIKNNKLFFEPNLNIYEDLIFLIRCLSYKPKVKSINLVLYHYVQRQSSYMNSKIRLQKAQQMEDSINFIVKYLELSDSNNVLSYIAYTKLYVKSKIIFLGDFKTIKSYINKWPETLNVLKESKISKYKKIILSRINCNIYLTFLLIKLYKFAKKFKIKK